MGHPDTGGGAGAISPGMISPRMLIAPRGDALHGQPDRSTTFDGGPDGRGSPLVEKEETLCRN